MTHRCTGAILTGGKSRRMGQPKAELVLPDGRTMYEHVSATLRTLCDDIVLLGTPTPSHTGPIIPDHHHNAGPLAGLESLLRSGLDSPFLVCACDAPLLTWRLLNRLVEAESGRAAVFQIEDESRPQPLPMRIDADRLSDVTAVLQTPRASLHALLERVDPVIVPVHRSDAERFTNVNTPDEYDRLCAALTE